MLRCRGVGLHFFMLHCFIVIRRRPRCCCLGNETHRKVDKKATTKCECEMCKEGQCRSGKWAVASGERGEQRFQAPPETN